jgi:hypothetical protein
MKDYRLEAENNLDEKTPMFCFCGRLATGLHTSRCSKYQKKLELEIKRLKKEDEK